MTLYISEEYLPEKDRGPDGRALAKQEWRHPEVISLHYNKLGTIRANDRIKSVIETILDLAAGRVGGHLRIIHTTDEGVIRSRLMSWREREEREEIRRQVEEEATRALIYDYCPRCGRETEQCKGANHRGQNRCMECSGGLADPESRQCANCYDLLWRQQRERRAGEPIVYRSEELGTEEA